MPTRIAPVREPVGPDQESVWDYPRPPAIEPVHETIRIVVGGVELVRTNAAYRILETSHPPTYYLPPDDIDRTLIERGEGRSFCEWKGAAEYWTVRVGDRVIENCGWSYPKPSKRFAALKDHVAFYAQPMDVCYVGDERATPQPGGFYGGWITSNVVGPFKGEPGTNFW
ncbi:MAG: DUF427 domain-containing protein [Planctomycetota bacterium]